MKEANNNSIVEQASVLKHALSRVMLVRDIPLALTRLMFIKYVLDNYIGADTVEKMQTYAQAQKMLAMRDTTNMSPLISVLGCIDAAYGLDLILSEPGSIVQYEAALFHENHINQKRNITDSMFKDVMDVLGRIDLQEPNKEEHKVGEEVAEFLLSEINHENKASLVRESGFTTTSHEVNSIAKGLLKLTPTDTFCDITAGLGISTLDITKEVRPRIRIADIERGYLAIATMLLIMYGYSDISAVAGNTLERKTEGIHGNKMFVDPPLMNRIRREGDNRRIEASQVAVEEILHSYLDDSGVAVIAVPSGFLFKTDRASKDTRRWLIDEGRVKAVIGLPPMWMGANVGTNLLVIEKARHNEVLLIDVSSEKRSNLGRKMIEAIVDAANNSQEKEGFSKKIPCSDFASRDYNLVPASYIIAEEKDTVPTVKEIDDELEKLYKMLSN